MHAMPGHDTPDHISLYSNERYRNDCCRDYTSGQVTSRELRYSVSSISRLRSALVASWDRERFRVSRPRGSSATGRPCHGQPLPLRITSAVKSCLSLRLLRFRVGAYPDLDGWTNLLPHLELFWTHGCALVSS